MQKAVTPRSRDEMLRDFPLEDGGAPNWYFRITEQSAGVWRVEGEDPYGRSVSRISSGDPFALLKEVVQDARQVTNPRRQQ